MAQHTVSIIIPVLNEAAIVKQSLERLQQHSEIEIIMVDGGSEDNTVAIAQQLVTVITVIGQSRAAQMNAGANIARGRYLAISSCRYSASTKLCLISDRDSSTAWSYCWCI